ncbi:glycosyltransferase [Candidatus Woesebacteria bacterium]|nr:glycosyltransferase [Candidatus Woesebacteria bacterium]
MKHKPTVTALIPVHNEKPRIKAVIEPVLKNPLIESIIVVDDHSTDGTREYIADEYPHVMFLSNPHPQGKSSAVFYGLSHISTEYVLLLDGDLVGLTERHIIKLIEPVVRSEADMTISYRELGSFKQHFLNFVDPMYNGDRCLAVKTLKSMYATFHPEGYGLETCMNTFALDNKMKIEIVPLPIRQVTKPEKRSFVQGVFQDLIMGFGIAVNYSLREKCRQIMFISLRFQLSRLL